MGKVNKGGAKGKYQEWLTPEGLIKIEGWAMDGLTDEQIAKNIRITSSTLYEWKKRYSEISEALKRGKEIVDRQVENALLKRALGYRYDEVTRELVEDLENGGMKLDVTKVVTKEVQPDVTAQIFWLKNRKPTEWRDKQQVEHSGEITNTIQQLTPEERQKRIEELKAKLK
ncbi:helix-turn-helix domain-containing protein [Solibacillus sp. A46]|uniref:Helix-turn-helix domain-containing protein n=2 Tax=Solibacillus faecavium TaxID=2762221 RepID=A0ABR8XYR8_9BACL|nr:helix-turn-helix domain-containing protein [Solibacillus faecavium]